MKFIYIITIPLLFWVVTCTHPQTTPPKEQLHIDGLVAENLPHEPIKDATTHDPSPTEVSPELSPTPDTNTTETHHEHTQELPTPTDTNPDTSIPEPIEVPTPEQQIEGTPSTEYVTDNVSIPERIPPAKPPFSGTIFVEKNIIQDTDPTTFVSLTPKGTGTRRMYDRRIARFQNFNAILFLATFSDGLSIEVQVNPEFTQADALTEAKRYLPVIGQLPYALRVDVKTVWIHKGVQPFGGGNNNLLIHTGQGLQYIQKGILAETFVHESAHTSLDAKHAKHPDWLAAQKKDGQFISTYTRDYPTREDIAETFLMYLALKYKPNRISNTLKQTLTRTIPQRIQYFEALSLNMQPIK